MREETETPLYAPEGISAERRLATRNAAVSALAESETVDEAVPRLLRAIGEGIGWDFGSVWLLDPSSELLRCEHTWSRPLLQAREFERATREISFPPGVGLPGRVWESGEPAWITDVTVDPNFPRAPFAEPAGLHSAFAFPILRSGEVLGVLEFFTREFREPDEALLADFGAFGFQLGQFIVREEAQRKLRESRDQLEAILRHVPAGIAVLDGRGRWVFVNEMAAQIAGFDSPGELRAATPEEVIGRFEVFDEGGDRLARQGLPGTEDLRGVESPEVVLRFRARGTQEDRWVIGRATPLPDERGGYLSLHVFEEVTEIKRTEEALRESEVRHREISEALQRGLLPPRRPEVPGLEVAVRFRALGEGAEIGGDFYDLFQTAPGRWAVVIGDVSGKGMEAAAIAALARYTVRATALHDDCPEHVLTMLNQAIGRQTGASRFCTAAYATIEPGELWTRLRIASAGHPLPLLVHSHGGTRHAGGSGPLLGTFDEARFEAEPVELARGDALVLYTDGVIEAGARSADRGRRFGPERLAELLGACAGLDAEQVATRVEHRVAEAEAGRPRDDAAIVVLRAVS